MATPIRNTPILEGKDAEAFQQHLNKVASGEIKIPKADYERARANFDRIHPGAIGDPE